ncbi:hypothetical protein P3L10_032232 [Capsicum annuum]
MQAKARLDACQTALQLDPKNLTLITQEASLAQDFIKWNKARVMYLQQKCKAHWLKDGDLNTTFFHSVLKTRRNANRIFRIQDQQGKDITDTQGIAQSFVHFYTSLPGYKTSGPEGYGSQFFKDCWEIIRIDLIAGMMEFFRTGKILKAWNTTVLTIIPKHEHANTVEDYRPIACSTQFIK